MLGPARPPRLAALLAAVVAVALAAPGAHAAEPLIYTLAGTGDPGYAGDGGPATDARLDLPRGVDVAPDGSVLFAEADNAVVRLVTGKGTIRTVAGTGRTGFGGDGGPATRARLNFVHGVAVLPGGGFLLADLFNFRIRRVSRSGVIRTVAGTGARGFSGDGGQARRARLSSPHGVFALEDGGFLIADTLNHRVRRVLPSGRIVTVAGRARRGYAGDGGRADRARLNQPKGVATTPDGGIAIADANNDAIRWVAPSRTRRLAIAVRGRTTVTRRGRPITVKVQATVAAALRVTILSRSGQRVRTEALSAAAGSTMVTLDKGLSPGRRRILVRARTSDGQFATARATLVVR